MLERWKSYDVFGRRVDTLGSRFFHPVEVAVVILLGEETGLSIDTALHDVLRIPREFYSWATRHS